MTSSLIRFTVAVAAAAAAATPVAAQSPGGSGRDHALDVVPYAGYLISGSYVNGPLGTDLKSANGPVFGVQLGLPLGGKLALVGNVAYSSADLKVGVPIVGGVSAGTSAEYLYDGALQLGTTLAGGGRSVSPFLQVGAGAIHRDLTVAGITARSTDLAFNAGVGVDVDVIPGVGLRLMAKDYVGKLDLGTNAIPVKSGTINNVALSVGLKVAF